MKTTKGGKVMNPTDAYRKELRKKELKRNKKEHKKVREVGILKKDPETIKEQIEKLEMMKADGALNKARKHKKRQLEDMLNLVYKKIKEYEEKMHDKGEAVVMFRHLVLPRRQTTSEEVDRVKHPKPEDSVYYHPTLNPTGAPPPGPRIPLSSTAGASSSLSELEDSSTAVPPPPPPPPLGPLPISRESNSVDDSGTAPPPLPLPPPPQAPPKPIANSNAPFPSPLLPPPPPGPSKESVLGHISFPPPPPPPSQCPTQPAPPGTSGKDREKNKNTVTDGIHLKESERATGMLPPPPPPPGLAPKPISNQFDATPSEAISISGSGIKHSSKTMPLPPPPPRHPPPMPQRLPLAPSLQSDMLSPGMVCYPPLLPPDMKPPLPVHGIPNQLPLSPPPPGMVPPSLARQQFAALPGPPAALRPMAPGIPFTLEDNLAAYKHSAPQKLSYVKSAASTVVKRPLAQHTPELTAMVPASVRVKRETAVQKMKPKPQLSASSSAPRPSVRLVVAGKPEAAAAPSASKGKSIDDSYMAFLEDMKAFGALDS